MNDEDLKQEVRRLREELEQEKQDRQREQTGDVFGSIIWLACVAGFGYWLFNGGFGEVARFLFWMGIFQR